MKKIPPHRKHKIFKKAYYIGGKINIVMHICAKFRRRFIDPIFLGLNYLVTSLIAVSLFYFLLIKTNQNDATFIGAFAAVALLVLTITFYFLESWRLNVSTTLKLKRIVVPDENFKLASIAHRYMGYFGGDSGKQEIQSNSYANLPFSTLEKWKKYYPTASKIIEEASEPDGIILDKEIVEKFGVVLETFESTFTNTGRSSAKFEVPNLMLEISPFWRFKKYLLNVEPLNLGDLKLEPNGYDSFISIERGESITLAYSMVQINEKIMDILRSESLLFTHDKDYFRYRIFIDYKDSHNKPKRSNKNLGWFMPSSSTGEPELPLYRTIDTKNFTSLSESYLFSNTTTIKNKEIGPNPREQIKISHFLFASFYSLFIKELGFINKDKVILPSLVYTVKALQILQTEQSNKTFLLDYKTEIKLWEEQLSLDISKEKIFELSSKIRAIFIKSI